MTAARRYCVEMLFLSIQVLKYDRNSHANPVLEILNIWRGSTEIHPNPPKCYLEVYGINDHIGTYLGHF